MKTIVKIILAVIAVVGILITFMVRSPDFQQKLALRIQEKSGQGTLEERQAHCAKTGRFFDPVPYSSHLAVHYVVTGDACYRKEPDLAPKTNTISVQRLHGLDITPIFRIINKYHYTAEGWEGFTSQLKKENESNYTEISTEAIPLFSPGLKEHIQIGDAVQITNCMGEQGYTCYYFTDREWMFFYTKYDFANDVDETAVYVDYQ